MLGIRTTKIIRDLWNNKSRSLLTVLAIATGVAACGLMLTGRIVLDRNLAHQFAGTNPAHSTLSVTPFGSDLVDKVRAVPGVQAVEARAQLQAKIEIAPDQWAPLELDAIADFNNLQIDRLYQQPGGTYPPPRGAILLERTVVALVDVGIGDMVRIQTVDGAKHELSVAGFVNDLSRMPTTLHPAVYGYVARETSGMLGQPTSFNRLYLVVDEHHRAGIERLITTVVNTVEQSGYRVLSAPVPEPGKHALDDNMTAVLLILQSLGVLTLALSAFLVINVMWAHIGGQIPQIGILKSIGGRTSQIAGLYFRQVLLLGLLALLLAVPIGAAGAYPVAREVAKGINFDIAAFHLPLPTLALQVVAAVLMPLLVAAVPILAGARLTIREAISDATTTNLVRRGLIDWLLAPMHELPQLLKLSIRNTFRRKGRLAVTFAGLSLAGAMFIAVVGIRQSLHGAVAEIAGALGYDVSIDFAQPYRIEQIERLALEVAGVSQVESWGMIDARRVYDDDRLSGSFTLIAVPPTTAMTRPSITAGRWLTPNESGMLFINADTRARIPDMVVGKTVRLRIGADERSWTVASVGSRELVTVGFINYADFERITQLPGYANRLVVRTAQQSFDVQNRVEQDLLRHFHAAGLLIASSETTAMRKQTPGQLDILIVLLMSMTIIIAIVGGLGLAITMGLNVMERTRDIGILRSLGATDAVVRRTVIGEGLVIGFISWAIGTVLSIPLGVWLGNAIGMSLLARPLDYIFSFTALLIWLALVGVIAVVASIIPAHHAARLTIRDTLAYAG